MRKFALVMAGMVLTGCATTSGPRALRIDGTNRSTFERSVTSIERELSWDRQQLFAIALASIWIANKIDADGADFDHDGDVDTEDGEVLLKVAADIRRGTAIGESEGDASSYTAEQYYRQLDGLGYDEVLDLAGPEIAQEYWAMGGIPESPPACRMLLVSTLGGEPRVLTEPVCR